MELPTNQPAGTASLDRAFKLMTAVIDDDGETPVTLIADRLALPGSTARRMLSALERQGLIARIGKGRYASGGRFIDLAQRASLHTLLTRIARRPLQRLASYHRATAHLGVFEDGMVTYLVKENPAAAALFTREMGQLEAYCTGVGKVLLADLDEDQLETFLAGSFVALTAQTIVEPSHLRAEIRRVRERGYAIDDREMDDNVFCVAVPLTDRTGRTVAAISLSGTPTSFGHDAVTDLHAELRLCASRVGASAGI